jgi:hypothetical protein
LLPLPAMITFVSSSVPVTLTSPPLLLTRSTRCVFLGYSPDHKGYRRFDLISCRVLISRHIVFDESDFRYSTSTPSPDPELASLLPDPVVQSPLSIIPFPAGFPGAPPSSVPSAAPRAVSVPPPASWGPPTPSAAPRVAPTPTAAPNAATRSPAVPRLAPAPLAAPHTASAPLAHYAESVQVYRRHPVPTPTQTALASASEVLADYAPPLRYVHERRSMAPPPPPLSLEPSPPPQQSLPPPPSGSSSHLWGLCVF